jgi:hypothetical protein
MIYGFVPSWMVKENPAFAEAVSRYYSLTQGKLRDAAIGEVAWRAMAEEMLRRSLLQGKDEQFYAPLIIRIVEGVIADQEARRRRDSAAP